MSSKFLVGKFVDIERGSLMKTVIETDVVLGDSARNIDWQFFEALPIGDIRPSNFNPRKDFDQAFLSDLAKSFKQNGIVQPIAVRAMLDGMEIICGEQRYRAAKMAGLETVPARVAFNMPDEQAIQIAVVENLQRKDINAIEEAQGFQALRDLGLQVQEIADMIGCAQSTISNAIRLLELPENVQSAVSAGRVTKSHARALVPFAECKELIDVLVTGIGKGLTSKEIEGFEVNKLPWEIRSEVSPLTTELGGWGCKFVVEDNCKGCITRVKRYCLKKECYNEKNAAAIAAENEAREAELADPEPGIINPMQLENDQFNYLFDLKLGCDADCEHIKQYWTSGNELKSLCLNPECFTLKRQAIKDKDAAEVQTKVDVIVGRSLDVISHDPDALRRLRVLAVAGTVGQKYSGFMQHLEAVTDRLGLQIDFSALEACINDCYSNDGKIKLLNALLDIPDEFLCLIVAEALLREEASCVDHAKNDWFCGVVAEDSATEDACGGNCDDCDHDCVNAEEEESIENNESIEAEEEIIGDAQDGGQADCAECCEEVELIADGAASGDAVVCDEADLVYAGTGDGDTAESGATAETDGDVESLSDTAETCIEEANEELELGSAEIVDAEEVNRICNTSVEDGIQSLNRCDDMDVLAAARARESARTNPRKTLIKAIDTRIRKIGAAK